MIEKINITTPNVTNTYFIKADYQPTYDYIQCPIAEAEGVAVLRYIPSVAEVVDGEVYAIGEFTISILPSSTQRNVPFTISGTSTSLYGKTVYAEIDDGSGYTVVGSTTINSDGTWSVDDAMFSGSLGTCNIRVRCNLALSSTDTIDIIATVTLDNITGVVEGEDYDYSGTSDGDEVELFKRVSDPEGEWSSMGTASVVDDEWTITANIETADTYDFKVEDTTDPDGYDQQNDVVVESAIETVAISVGSNHSLAIINGKVYAWGSNSNGQLGDGTTTQRTTPTAMNAVSGQSSLYGKTPVQVSAGDAHSLILCSDGTVHAVGANATGQIGDGTTTQRTKPVLINGGAISGKSIVWISAGMYGSSACVDADGKAYAWGDNTYNQVGDGTTTQRNAPVAIATDTSLSGRAVTQISMGYYGGHCTTSDGRFHGWGANGGGRIGDNSSTARTKPVLVHNTTSLYGKTGVRVDDKYDHTIFLCSDGTVHACGTQYSSGNLGDGATGSQSRPVAVATDGVLSGKTIVSISCGHNNGGMCVDSAGKVYGWGNNGESTIGDNTTENKTKPVATSTATALSGKTVVDVASNNTCTLAIGDDGAIYGWGSNGSYQVGDGTNTVRRRPVATTMPA